MNNVARRTPSPGHGIDRRPRAHWSALAQAGVLFAASGACAAQVPDAGRMLREATPPIPFTPPQAPLAVPPAAPMAAPAPKAGQASFVLTAVSFNGNTVFTGEALQALVADTLGKRVTLADLQLLAARVTEHYRAHELILTQTVVPSQDITGGKVEFSVLEGRLGQVRIERINDVAVPDSVVQGLVAGLPKGQPMTRLALERAVLMLSDLPGMVTQASLEAGDEAGTFDLVLELKAAPRTNLSVDLDNQGSRATGEYRIGASARINSPFGRGDNFDLRLLNAFGKGLTFGRGSYELPVGARGVRASLAYARVEYELGKDFAALGAYGTADVVELAATYPLLRSRAQNLFGKASVEFKRLKDHLGTGSQASLKHMGNLAAGFVYERRDGWMSGGYVSASLTGYIGKLDIRSQADLLLDQDGFGRHTNGRFARASYQMSRLQYLSAKLSAYLALAGQWANKNLDSADKIAGGGPRTIRAFSGSTGIGDEARIVNAELRWSVTPDASLSLFYDIGRVCVNHTPLAGEDNHRSLSGYGLGLYWTVAGGAALRASVAWPRLNTGPSSSNDERSPRAYAQLVKVF